MRQRDVAIGARFTAEEAAEIRGWLAKAGTNVHDVLMSWVRNQQVRQEAEAFKAAAEDAAEEWDRNRARAAHADETARKAEARLAKLEEQLAKAERARAMAIDVLTGAGVAPDDPAIGVLLAAIMLKPVAEAYGQPAIARALGFLQAAADAVRQVLPEGPDLVDATFSSLMRRIEAAEAEAAGQIPGDAWGRWLAARTARRNAWHDALTAPASPPPALPAPEPEEEPEWHYQRVIQALHEVVGER